MTLNLVDLLDLQPEAISNFPLAFQFLSNPLGQSQVSGYASTPVSIWLISEGHI